MKRFAEKRHEVALVALVIVAGAYYAVCSLLIHRSYHSNGWDLGLINQVIWNTGEGRWFEYSFRLISYAGDHWQPLILVFVPLNRVFPGPEPLLVAQAVLFAVAAVPLWYAAREVAGVCAAWALVVAYLFGLAVAQAVSFDFHAEAAVPLIAFGAVWALASGRRWVFVALCAVFLTEKEDSVLLVLGLAWIAFMVFDWRREAAGVAVGAMVYAVVANAVIVPHYRGEDLNPLAERYGYLGDSAAEVALGVFVHPDRVAEQVLQGHVLAAVFYLLLGVGFLPLAQPKLLPALALVLFPPLLSQDFSQPRLELHYLVVPGTMALIISMFALRRIPGGKYRSYITQDGPPVLAGMAVVLFLAKSPLPPSFAAERDRFDVDAHAAASDRVVARIPDGVVVSAQSAFVAHLAERERIFQFPRVLDSEFVITDQYGPVPSDDREAGYDACLAALPRLGFDKVMEEDGITLWEKRREAEAVPEVPEHCSGQRPGSDE